MVPFSFVFHLFQLHIGDGAALVQSLAAQLEASDASVHSPQADSAHSATDAGETGSAHAVDNSTVDGRGGSSSSSSSGNSATSSTSNGDAWTHRGESIPSEVSRSTTGCAESTSADVASLDGFGHADIIFVDADSDDTR